MTSFKQMYKEIAAEYYRQWIKRTVAEATVVGLVFFVLGFLSKLAF